MNDRTRSADSERTALNPKWLRAIAWAAYLTSLSAGTLHVATHPAWNLDGVFYSALMHSPREPIDQVHAQVYAQVESQVPLAAAKAIMQGSTYRRQLHRSAQAFFFQLPFYLSKPLYAWLGRGLTAAGMSSIRAPYAVSAACFGLIGALLPFFAIRAGAMPSIALAVAALALWLPQFRELGALATPDALATALIVAGAAFSLSSLRIAALALATAALARPDAAILALGVLVAAWLREPTRPRAREALGLGMAVSAVAVLVGVLSGAYGWATVMRQTFFGRIVDVEGLRRSLSLHEYFDAVGRGLRGHMTDQSPRALPFLALAGLGAYAYVKLERDDSQRAAMLLLAAIWGATLVRFLAFPLLADRFFAPAYVCTLALSCALWCPSTSSPTKKPHGSGAPTSTVSVI